MSGLAIFISQTTSLASPSGRLFPITILCSYTATPTPNPTALFQESILLPIQICLPWISHSGSFCESPLMTCLSLLKL